MTTPTPAHDLVLPRPARTPAALEPPSSGLIRTGRATSDVHVFAGRRVVVRATGLGGVERIDADGCELTGRVRLSAPTAAPAPTAAHATVTPRTMTREQPGAGGVLHETVAVPERLPGCTWQWMTATPLDGLIEVDIAPGEVPPDVVSDEGVARWRTSADGTGGVVQISGVREPAWEHRIVEGRHRLCAEVRLDPGTPATLLVSGVAPDARLPSLQALAALRAHRRRDELEPSDAPGLTLATGVADLDEGTAWARALLRAAVEEVGGASRIRWGEAPEMARSALAAGELEVARVALAHSPPSLDDADARARWVAWTGKPHPLLDARDRLDPLLAEAPQPVRTRMADAAEAAGDEEWAARLRMVVARDGGRRLPTVGGRPTTTAASSTLPRTPSAPAGDEPVNPEALVAAIATVRSDAPTPGLALLREALAKLREESTGASPEAAAALRLLVEGMLGVEPDAAFGRIRLAPCLPESWDALHVQGIQIGDALVDMQMSRTDHRYRFCLRQRAGGAPVTWIFAPRLPGASIDGVRVDGQEALVDSQTVGDRIEPRIQIPAERERIVEIDVTPP